MFGGREGQQTVAVAAQHRLCRHHLRIKARAPRQETVEEPAMPVGPIHHGGDAKAALAWRDEHAIDKNLDLRWSMSPGVYPRAGLAATALRPVRRASPRPLRAGVPARGRCKVPEKASNWRAGRRKDGGLGVRTKR